MMKLPVLLIAIVLLSSCSDTGEGKQFSGSDSLVINFNAPGTNNIEKTMTTTENKAIKKLAGFINGKATGAFKCGYDGNLMFYQQGLLLGDVAFNFSGEGCHHFILSKDGKLTPTAMSNEAADFLRSLAEGKGWY
jgi:hypothetical protein